MTGSPCSRRRSRESLSEAGVDGADVVGLGIDFTSCTVLPVHERRRCRCASSSTGEAARTHGRSCGSTMRRSRSPTGSTTSRSSAARTSSSRYGGRISSEWYFPKLIEVWLEDRDVYDACAAFIEATDWLVWWMTGRECRQTCTAGYKALWSPDEGLPSSEYFDGGVSRLRPPGGEAWHDVRPAR